MAFGIPLGLFFLFTQFYTLDFVLITNNDVELKPGLKTLSKIIKAICWLDKNR